MADTITKDMLDWELDLVITAGDFSVKEDAFGSVQFRSPTWQCKGVTLRQILRDGAFGGNSLRVGFVNKVVRKLKTERAASALVADVSDNGIDVANLISGRFELPITVQARNMSVEDLRKTIAELQELEKVASQPPAQD